MQAKKHEKENQVFHNYRVSYLVQLRPRVTKFKLVLPSASFSGPGLDVGQKKMKKKIEHFTFIGPVVWCSFNPESQNSTSRYQELHNSGPSLDGSQK
jgi:hypothetical protein